jgi:hypothetical protein
MNGVKPTTGWQTVKSRTEEKKKKQEEKRKEKQQAEQKKDRLGVTAKSDVFAVFDRVYQEEAAAAKPSKPQLHGDYKGAYAHLANEGPTAAGAASDSDASEEEPASSANGTSEAAAAAAAKTKKPKVKKPKIMFATIAESEQQQGRVVMEGGWLPTWGPCNQPQQPLMSLDAIHVTCRL